jgi:hypothetical protein
MKTNHEPIRFPAIERLLENIGQQGHDVYGFIHFVNKELYEDAKEEYRQITRPDAKRTKS